MKKIHHVLLSLVLVVSVLFISSSSSIPSARATSSPTWAGALSDGGVNNGNAVVTYSYGYSYPAHFDDGSYESAYFGGDIWYSFKLASEMDIYSFEITYSTNSTIGDSIIFYDVAGNVLDSLTNVATGVHYVNAPGARYINFKSASSYITEWTLSNEGQAPPPEGETLKNRIFIGNKAFYKLEVDGDVYAWGSNDYGQLGLGDTNKRKLSQKAKVTLPEPIIDLVVEDGFVVALGESGDVYGWGNNASGVLGDTDGIFTAPVLIDTDIDEIIGN